MKKAACTMSRARGPLTCYIGVFTLEGCDLFCDVCLLFKPRVFCSNNQTETDFREVGRWTPSQNND